MKAKTVLFLLFLATAVSVAKEPAEAVFFVSATGDDAAKGTAGHPWKTPAVAAGRVQDYMQAHPGVPVKLVFGGGEYFISDSLVFKHLGAPLTLAGTEGERTIFTGEKRITGWSTVTDEATLARMSPSAGGRVLWADLAANGIKDPGSVVDLTNRFDLYCNGKKQTLARWPDKGFTEGGRAVGETELGDTWIHVHGTREGIVEYKDDRIGKWADDPDPYLFGYWYWDWLDWYYQLQSVDNEKKTFTAKPPYHKYGFRDGCRFYGLNLLCELDSPGEFYVDRDKSVIYWIAPEGVNPSEAVVTTPVYSGEMMIRVEDCPGFRIESMEFCGGRNSLISIKKGDSNVIRDCRISRFGKTPVFIAGGKDHRVEGCLLEELGCGGIDMKGGDRKTLEGCGFKVTNTIVDNFSLFKRTYEPAVHFEGCGMLISHCLFQNSSSSAMRIEGNDVKVQYCQCFDLVQESDDQGGVDIYFDYSYRRIEFKYNHWRGIRGGMFAGAAGVRFDDIISGQVVYGNIFESCGGGGANFGGVQINGGRDNWVSNNVFYDCPWAVSGGARVGQQWFDVLESNMSRVQSVGGLGPVYSTRYPEIVPGAKSADGVNYVYDNIVVNANSVVADATHFFLDNNTVIKEDKLGLEHYLKSSTQKEAGLTPIPFKKIGVKENRWMVR